MNSNDRVGYGSDKKGTIGGNGIDRFRSLTVETVEATEVRLHIDGLTFVRRYYQVRMRHKVEIIFEKRVAIVIRVIIVISRVDITVDNFFIPVRHTILISIEVGRAMFFRIHLPSTSIIFMVDFPLDTRA